MATTDVRPATGRQDRPYDKRWWTLGVLCLSLLVTTVDNTILNVALPSIVRDLHAQGSQLQWIVDGYTIVFAGLLLTAGSLGDRLGRKGALTIGLLLFAAFSACASQSTSPGMLITFRALMGIGGALIFPTTLSILSNTFTGRERARAIGIWAGVAGLGVAIGPLGGGTLLEHFWWGSVFLVNVPICLLAIVAGAWLVPTSKDPDEGRLDPVGAVLSIVGLAALLYGIIQAPEQGWSDPTVVGGLVVGLVIIAAFLVWERRTDHPMLDVRFFADPRFSAASSTITLTYLALFGSTFILTQYFQFVLGYSPLKAGMLTAPVAVGLMGVAPQAPKVVDRIGTSRTIVIGLAVVASALLLYSSDSIMSSVIWGGCVRALFGAGMGLTTAPATESIMGSLPPGKAGVGSAVNDTTRQTGGALGVAILGSLLALRYHHALGPLEGVPADVHAAAHDSVGRALQAAARLDPAQRDLVDHASRRAFVTAMRPAFWLAASFVACAGLISWRFLPAHGRDHEPA